MRAIQKTECHPMIPAKGKQLEIAVVSVPVKGYGYSCDSVVGFGDPEILKLVSIPYGTKLKILGGTDLLPLGSVIEVVEGTAVTRSREKVKCLGIKPVVPKNAKIVYAPNEIPGSSLANNWLVKLLGAKVEVLG